MKFILGSAIIISLFAVGCSHQQVRYDSSQKVVSEVGHGGGLEAHVNWVKIKGPKIDMEVALTNTSEEYIKLDSGSFQINYNGSAGVSAPHGMFMETLNMIGPHISRKGYVYFSFTHGIAKKGTAQFTIDPIYASPTGEPTTEKWRKLKPVSIDLPID